MGFQLKEMPQSSAIRLFFCFSLFLHVKKKVISKKKKILSLKFTKCLKFFMRVYSAPLLDYTRTWQNFDNTNDNHMISTLENENIPIRNDR